MAGPFAGAGLSQFGGESKYMPSGGEGGGLGAIAGLYLADAAGLVDLKNMSDKDKQSMQKNGPLHHFAMKALNGAAKPPSSANFSVSPVTVGGPMNQEMPQGVPLDPMSSAEGVESVDMLSSGLDHELIESSLPNFAALFS